jgi:2-amino-4-hydroxy-6-hydroxymethyldihydropteridine diphosphokinase
MAKVYFSSGSNQGDRLDWLLRAAKYIDQMVGNILRVSPVVESEPWGFDAEAKFYNQVLLVETELTPHQVLHAILDIEKTLGRIRSGATYSSRNIDIDILFYDEVEIDEASLKIPHPLLHKREFVLVPFASIAPDLVHPLFQMSISGLLTQLGNSSKVKIVSGANEFTELLKTTKLN